MTRPSSASSSPRPSSGPASGSASGPASGSPAAARWSDLERPPLNATALRRALVRPAGAGLWRELQVVAETGSTNTDLAERVRAGDAHTAPEGVVLVAEQQTAGRGRLDRDWVAPARSGLFFSVLLRPGAAGVPRERWGWLPLLAGVATATALARTAGVDTALKWPNDLLVTVDGEERKLGGILGEQVAPERAGGVPEDAEGAVVLGVGLNVSLRAEELPVPTAGSLKLAGAPNTDRDPLLRAVLRSLADWYVRWRDAGGDPAAHRLQEAYTAGCATLGRSVRVLLPGGREETGRAVAIDAHGRLVLSTADGRRLPVSAGDVVHLRPHPER